MGRLDYFVDDSRLAELPCGCERSAGDGCPECDPRLAELRDDIDLTQCIEVLTRSVTDVETGEPLFDDAHPDLYAPDVRRVIALLGRIMDARVATRRGVA